jgi:hypothetical protein
VTSKFTRRDVCLIDNLEVIVIKPRIAAYHRAYMSMTHLNCYVLFLLSLSLIRSRTDVCQSKRKEKPGIYAILLQKRKLTSTTTLKYIYITRNLRGPDAGKCRIKSFRLTSNLPLLIRHKFVLRSAGQRGFLSVDTEVSSIKSNL